MTAGVVYFIAIFVVWSVFIYRGVTNDTDPLTESYRAGTVHKPGSYYEPVEYENTSDPLRFESLFGKWKAYVAWIRACTDSDITSTYNDWMIAVETGLDTDSVVECLLPGSDDNARAFVHDPPFDNAGNRYNFSGSEVLFRNNDSILIVTPQGLEIGNVLHVAGDTYLVQFIHYNYKLIYIVHPEERGGRELINGDKISIEDVDNLIFRVDGYKVSRTGWFSFIIDYYGEILDTAGNGSGECPNGDLPGAQTSAAPVATIAKNTSLDLSRVTKSFICFES